MKKNKKKLPFPKVCSRSGRMQAAFSVSLSANWCVTHRLSRRAGAGVPVGPTTARQDGRGREMKQDLLVEDSKKKKKKKINRDDDDVADDSRRFFPLAHSRIASRYLQTTLSRRCSSLAGSNKSRRLVFRVPRLTRLRKRHIVPLLYSQSWDEGNI